MSEQLVRQALEALAPGDHRIFELWRNKVHYSIIVHHWQGDMGAPYFQVISIGPAGIEQEAGNVRIDEAVRSVMIVNALVFN